MWDLPVFLHVLWVTYMLVHMLEWAPVSTYAHVCGYVIHVQAGACVSMYVRVAMMLMLLCV